MKWLKLLILIFVFSQSLFSQIGNTNKRNGGDRARYSNFRKGTHNSRPRYGNNEINFKLDENKIHLGVIPYFFLSRSYGTYASFPLSKIISAEYRFSYTFPTNYRTYYFPPTNDIFYFKGLNNFMLINFRMNNESSISLIGGYRNWWYNNKGYTEYTSGGHGPYHHRSVKMDGFCFGMEVSKKHDLEKLDLQLFCNMIFTHFSGKLTILDVPYNPFNLYGEFPQYETFVKEKFNISLGVKVGLNIKKSKK
ncbi:MAG: hypothetical protein V4622_07975 [Bacteroidota bacterium]